MKGASTFLTSIIFIGFSLFLILVVVNIVNSLTDEYRNYITDGELEQLCFTIRSAIEKIYGTTDYMSQTNTTYGKIILNLPEKVGGARYLAQFSGTNIFIEALNGEKKLKCRTGFNLTYSGSTTGGLTEIKYMYYTNGTKTIFMSKL